MKDFNEIIHINEATKSPDYEQGYNDAINRIREIIDKMQSEGASDQEIEDALDKASDEHKGQRGRPKPKQPQDPEGNSNNDMSDLEKELHDAIGGKSRTSSKDENQGIVRPEDCQGPSSLNNTPGTPGGMIDRATGDAIAKGEGYEPEGGSDSALESKWKDQAVKMAGKLPGNSSLKSKIENLYKSSTDWKKELRKIVGQSISPEEKRSAYANKNVLISQNRLARTDKDKYENLDYIVAVIDSSGSMQDHQLKLCLKEVYQLALQKKPLKIYVIQCDTKIQDLKVYTNVKQLEKDIKVATVKGRGGTEFKPVWDELKNGKYFKGKQAELVMLFTDGYLNQYKRDPRSMKNLCWVILDNPSWQLENKDINTKVIYLKTESIK